MAGAWDEDISYSFCSFAIIASRRSNNRLSVRGLCLAKAYDVSSGNATVESR